MVIGPSESKNKIALAGLIEIMGATAQGYANTLRPGLLIKPAFQVLALQ
jgi:hypothetical protein